ncbi:hypothetical protein [Anaerorhabdus sp.]|uniref:hypothetical protein n=1 Tax=Anaerorhabdus sp. TaxID=1872524 RepID=UPI002FC73632
MKTIKKFWGIIPIAIYIVVKLILLIVEKTQNLVLRAIPQSILLYFAIFSVFVFILYLIHLFFSLEQIKKYKFMQVIKFIIFFIYGLGIVGALWVCIFISGFVYKPEDVVFENGIKMVSVDSSYIDLSEDYYQHVNFLFRGKQVLKKIRENTYWIYDVNGDLIETGTYEN